MIEAVRDHKTLNSRLKRKIKGKGPTEKRWTTSRVNSLSKVIRCLRCETRCLNCRKNK